MRGFERKAGTCLPDKFRIRENSIRRDEPTRLESTRLGVIASKFPILYQPSFAWILLQESLSETVRLKTGRPGVLSGSLQK